MQVDRAVFYGIFSSFWSTLAGPVTMIMILFYFSSELQGLYYTFNSLLALRVFVELGLGTVIIAFSSHEWAKLNLDEDGYIVGDINAISRLVSLSRFAFKWHFIGGLIVLIGLGFGGYLFFSHEKTTLAIDWKWPWLFLCSLTAITIWLTPALFLLEGCNQIKNIFAFRLFRAICINISTWTAISLGAGLWSLVIFAAVDIVCLVVFIFSKYRHFLMPMISYVTTSVIDWRTSLWPMQWRISLSWMSGYFMSSFFTPLIFHYHGAVAAGQFGMTWAILGAISTFSSIWLTSKRPQFGMLIAKKDYISLDKLFFRSAIILIGVFTCGVLALWLLIYFLNAINHQWAVRLLSPATLGIFVVGMIVINSSSPFSAYIRAHHKAPLYWIDISSAILATIFVWPAVKYYSSLGLAISYTVIQSCYTAPLIIWGWYRYRDKWHKIDD